MTSNYIIKDKFGGNMKHEFRALAKGVVGGEYVFDEFEAKTMILASRNNGPFELAFYEQSISVGDKNFVKFVSDEEFVSVKDVVVMQSNSQDYSQHVARNMKWEFLKENPTPTLREVRALNKRIINTQKNIKNNESMNEK